MLESVGKGGVKGEVWNVAGGSESGSEGKGCSSLVTLVENERTKVGSEREKERERQTDRDRQRQSKVIEN